MAFWHFLAYFIFTSCQVAGQSPIYALQGREVNFKPNITGRPDAILWRHNGKMVVEFDGQVEWVYGPYKNRIILDWDTAELDITDLRFEDSGDYELRKYTEVLQRFHFKLEVLDHVAKPTISCEMDDGGSNICGTLVCSAEPRQPQSLMTFEWRFHGKVQPGPELTISLGDEYDDEVYSCRVSNPLSKETTTFTAKDCYPEINSERIGVPVPIAILHSLSLSLLLSLLLMGLGIFCCKKHHKACFAKRNRHDPENPTHPVATKGSDENTADERRGLIDRTPTIPSTQRLNQEQDLQDTWPKEGSVRSHVKQLELNIHGETLLITFPAGSLRNKESTLGDADADQLSKPADEESPHHEKENEPKPADVSTNMMSDLEPSTASEHQDLEKDEDEEGKSPPANVATPVPKLRSQFTQTPPNTDPEVNTGGQKEDTNLDEVSGETDTSGVGETNESGASSEDEQWFTVSEQKDSETTRHDQDPNLSQSETHTSEDNQQEMDKPVPAAEKESGSEGNNEEPDLSSASSHQPQSSTPTKPDNRSTDTFKESPDAAHDEPVQGGEGKTTKESDESGESEDDTGEDKK